MRSSEKTLVEKVELRLALADSPEKIQQIVDTYLAPLLLKLSSKEQAVRLEVIKCIKIVLARFNAYTNLKLPVDTLIKQAKYPQVPESNDIKNVQLYSLLFASKGISRLSNLQKQELLPSLIEGISDYNQLVNARLFGILCKLIISYDKKDMNVDNGDSFRKFLQLDGKNAGYEHYLIEKFSQFMLLQPVKTDASGLIPRCSLPGLSEKESSFFTYDAGLTFNYQDLTQYKQKILLFTEFGFTKQSALIDICASADQNSSISDLASNILHRKGIESDDHFIHSFLEKLFMGDETAAVPPARVQLQAKIMEGFCKSESVLNSTNLTKIIEVGLNSSFPKLKSQTITFIRWVTMNLPSNVNSLPSEKFARTIRDNLLSEKVDEISIDMSNYLLQRRYQYEALGLILGRCPGALDMNMLRFLFDMLKTEMPELRTSVIDILSSLIVRLSEFKEKERLKKFLTEIIDSDFGCSVKPDEWECSARYIAVKFVNQAFPFHDAEARMLDILVQTKNDKPETIQEACKGLQPYLYETEHATEIKSNTGPYGNQVQFPSFESLIDILVRKETNINLAKATKFCFETLIMNSIEGSETLITCDADWELRIDNATEFDRRTRLLLQRQIRKLCPLDDRQDMDGDICMDKVKSSDCGVNTIHYFLSTCFKYFIGSKDTDVGRLLVILVSLSPASLVDKFLNQIPLLIDTLPAQFSRTVSTYVSQILGILCSSSCFTKHKLDLVFNGLLEHEQLQPLCYIVSRAMITRGASIFSEPKFTKLLSIIHYNLQAKSSEKIYVAMDSLSQLALFGCLGPKIQILQNINDQKRKFIEELKPLLRSTHEDLAAMTWSYMSLTCLPSNLDTQVEADNITDNYTFESALFETYSTSHTNFLFSVGEAFTILAMGWNSGKLSTKFDLSDSDIQITELIPKFDHVDQILEVIFRACKSTKPKLRKAGCIWLLSMVQFCKGSPEIIHQLPRLQTIFIRYLSDREQIIQESASRGLSIVYNLGDNALKDELIHNMMLSFSDSTNTPLLTSGTIEGSTELFEPGVLGTKDGSISTYKDVLNLASEAGDPSLVYKFMSLAKNSSLWSSRKGVAYGLEAIFDRTKLDDILQKDEHLSQKLIPNLYRYRFDPNLSVSRVMNDIWDSLIVDSNSLIVNNFALIFDSLIKGMGDHEWRIRQSSAAALNDLLQRCPETNFFNKITLIWRMAFRILDDIKESVRNEGISLTKNLMQIMIHTIEKEECGSKDALEQLLPFLLGTNGILNNADDVKTFSLRVLMKIIKTRSKSLKPFAAETIKQLILLMSSIEPQAVNYLSLNADKYKLTVEDIDAQRLSLLNSSPIMEAIETLMDLLDDALMPDFLDQLSDAVKKSVNLPSKVTASKIIVDLIVKYFPLAKDYGDKLLKICMSQLKSHNSTIAGSYAVATGYCVRVSSSKKIYKLSKKLLKYYFEAPSDDNHLQLISAKTCLAIVNYSKDMFDSVDSSFAPLIFVGKHDTDHKVSSSFREAWNESNGFGVNTIKLYLSEIVKLIKTNINTNNIGLRRTLGITVTSIIQNLGKSVDAFSNCLLDLYSILLSSLVGRSYDGKETLLNSLVLLSINSAAFLNSYSELHERVAKCVLKEASRQNVGYRKYSVKALGKYLGFFTEDQKFYDAYISCMRSFLEKSYKEELDFDVDDVSISKKDDLKVRNQLRNVAFRRSLLENMTIAINEKEPNSKLIEFIFEEVFKLFTSDDCSDFRTKLVLMESLKKLIIKLDHAGVINNSKESDLLINSVLEYWQIFRKEFSTHGNIQRVVIEFIRLTTLLAEILSKKNKPFDTDEMIESLRKISIESSDPIVSCEAKKSLVGITAYEV